MHHTIVDKQRFSRPIGIILLSCLLMLPVANSANAADDTAEPDLIIYTAEGTRGYRVIWLAEELGIDYEARFVRGNVRGSFAELREVNPLMGQAPTIFYQGTMMVESGGILQYLLSQHGNGRLEPNRDDLEDYMDYLQWLHFAEGSALPILFSEARGGRYATIGPASNVPFTPGTPVTRLVGTQRAMAFIESYLAEHAYFGGDTFSAADIMMHFIAELAPDPNYFAIDLSDYPNFAAWEQRVESRPAYIRAMQVALPDQQECPRLPNCQPVTSQ